MGAMELEEKTVQIRDDFDPDKILASGQCFRPRKQVEGWYRFVSGRQLLYLRPLRSGTYTVRCEPGAWETFLARLLRPRPQLCRPARKAGQAERLFAACHGIWPGHPGAAAGRVGDAGQLHHLAAKEHPGHPQGGRAAFGAVWRAAGQRWRRAGVCVPDSRSALLCRGAGAAGVRSWLPHPLRAACGAAGGRGHTGPERTGFSAR